MNTDWFEHAEHRKRLHAHIASRAIMAAVVSSAPHIEKRDGESHAVAYNELLSLVVSLLENAFLAGLSAGEDIGFEQLRKFQWPSDALVILSLDASETEKVGDFEFNDSEKQADFVSHAVVFVSQFAGMERPRTAGAA